MPASFVILNVVEMLVAWTSTGFYAVAMSGSAPDSSETASEEAVGAADSFVFEAYSVFLHPLVAQRRLEAGNP